jgi:uncharacterized membrane protein YcaP (DUF421 family)
MENLKWIIGLDVEDLNILQMGLRAVIIYLSALLIVRIGDKRFLGKTTAFDFILGIIIGSVLSRAINGGAAFLPSILTALILVAVHWLFGAIAFRFNFFGKMVKGKPRELIKDGKINRKQMRKAHISEDDLKLELRHETGTEKMEEVQNAYFERNGKISFIKFPSKTKVTEVKVEDGVQTVKIMIE